MEFDECEVPINTISSCKICNSPLESGEIRVTLVYKGYDGEPQQCYWMGALVHLRCWLGIQKCNICNKEFKDGYDLMFRAYLNSETGKIEMKPIHHWCGVKRDIKWTLRKLIAWALKD